MIYCSQCAKKMANNTVYCYHCGAKNKLEKNIRSAPYQPKQDNQSLLVSLVKFFFK